MLNFLGKLFGSEKALDSVVSGTVRGLDALVYTSEEQAQDAAASVTEARRMVVAWQASTQGQNLARRLIALSITAVWLLQFIVAQALTVAAVWASPSVVTGAGLTLVTVVGTADRLKESASVLTGGAAAMNGAVMLILAVLLQSNKGAGLGILGGSSDSLLGSTSGDVMTKITSPSTPGTM